MSVIDILIRALKLDSELYEEIEKNQNLQRDSIIIGAGAVILSAIGFKAFNIFNILVAAISVSIALALWIATIYLISLKLLSVRINPRDFLRCLLVGFSPMLFNILYFVPMVGFYLSVAIFIWTVVSISVVLKEVLEQESTTCLVISAMGSVIYFIVLLISLG